ncbi:Hsp90 cochaperone [Geranomyces variabilis]|uniref:Hsp90 cochaperone n=1 Tax=Geranomyces variabilis TaxID=109894 RepID=A0AAD5XMW7_9FUNG|nr:Hsp90 cochaperone [Geranomyces variabilis]
MESILAGLTEQLTEFESFVDSYTSQMDDILSGKSSIDDKEWARSQFQEPITAPTISKEAAKAAEAAVKESRSIDYSKWDAMNFEERDDETPVKKSPILTPRSLKKDACSPAMKHVLEVADAYRLEGNAQFKKEDFAAAVAEYTKAINVCLQPPQSRTCDSLLPDVESHSSFSSHPNLTVDAKLYTNRALAYLRIGNHAMAVRDCSAAIAVDETCIKAWWRRAEAWRGLREFFKAKSDVIQVREIVKQDQRPDLGLSILEVERMLAIIDIEMKDAQREKTLAKELSSDGSATVMQTLIDSFAKSLGKRQAGVAGTALDAEARAASEMLVRLICLDTSIADAFRICRGFDTLLAPKHFTSETVPFVLPVISASLAASPSNRREIASHIGQIVATISASRPEASTIEIGTGILFSAACEDVGIDAICKINVAGKQFGAFLKRLLSKEEDASNNELVAGHIIGVLTAVFHLGPNGQQIVTSKWDVSIEFLLDMLPHHLVSGFQIAEGTPVEPLFVHAYRLLDALLAAGASSPAALKAITSRQASLLEPVWAAIANFTPLRGSSSSPSSLNPHVAPLLGITHNILLKAPTPIPTILDKHSVLRRLVDFLSLPSPHPMLALKSLSRLLGPHNAEVIATLDGWWDDVPMLQLLTAEETVKPAAQLMAAWLASGDAQVAEWLRCGGFKVLRDLVTRQAVLDSAARDENLVGNLALCVAECARNASNAKRLHLLDITESLVLLLRGARCSKTQKNLAIACARLSQNAAALETIRRLQGVELMYNLGSKIL